MSKNDDDLDVVALVALGVIAVAGAGIWLVCKAFGNFRQGEEVTEDELEEAGHTLPAKFDDGANNDDQSNSVPPERWIGECQWCHREGLISECRLCHYNVCGDCWSNKSECMFCYYIQSADD